MKFNSDETILPTCAQADFRFILGLYGGFLKWWYPKMDGL